MFEDKFFQNSDQRLLNDDSATLNFLQGVEQDFGQAPLVEKGLHLELVLKIEGVQVGIRLIAQNFDQILNFLQFFGKLRVRFINIVFLQKISKMFHHRDENTIVFGDHCNFTL